MSVVFTEVTWTWREVSLYRFLCLCTCYCWCWQRFINMITVAGLTFCSLLFLSNARHFHHIFCVPLLWRWIVQSFVVSSAFDWHNSPRMLCFSLFCFVSLLHGFVSVHSLPSLLLLFLIFQPFLFFLFYFSRMCLFLFKRQ